MALVEVKVPDIGDFDEVAVIELLVKVGDTVKAEQSLITVESDKASMEIPSSTAGVVKELRVNLGDKVKEGSVVLVVEAAGAAAATGAAATGAGAGATIWVVYATGAGPLLTIRTLPSASVILSSDTLESETRSINVLSFRKSITTSYLL